MSRALAAYPLIYSSSGQTRLKLEIYLQYDFTEKVCAVI